MIHSTDELESVLGERIVARVQMHAWPLSCVESLATANGKRYVYKVQHEPTVEPEFFALAKTRLLPGWQVLQRDAQQAAMLFPFIEAPTLLDRHLDEVSAVAHGRALIQQIGEIGGDVPVYVDLGTVENWRMFSGKTLEMLSALVDAAIFKNINQEDLDALAQWVKTREVLEAVERTSQLINGDLKVEHVFCVGDGYQVIDWQRPYRAPGDIDLVLFLDSQKIPAQKYVAPASIGLRGFLFLHWAVEAKTNLLPGLPFFDHWARSGIDMICLKSLT